MPPRILIVDNYDSFTYNTVHALGRLGAQCEVVLNDRVSLEQVAAARPSAILLSAGPGTPDEAGITLPVIERFAGAVPILGVCLGHQAIARAFGGAIVRAQRLMHGKTSRVRHDGTGLFESLPNPAFMARYNSLLVDEASLPSELRVTARSVEGELMALAHVRLPIAGVQFHPESVLSEKGDRLFENWLYGLRAKAPSTPRTGA